ncbi:MAG: hypothetical protein IPG00_15175 [Saprospiraceae bacterium]|nr:hypothetical protein [Saprospiraceae bacterium]
MRIEVAIPCYIGGSRQAGSNYANLDVFVSYPWSNAGQSTPPDHDENYNTLGSVWGTAFKGVRKIVCLCVFKEAYVLGPDGLGAIYQIDYSNGGVPTVSTLVDLKAAPFNLNLGIFDESDASRFLSPTTPVSEDPEAFGKVGKVGFGNLTISDDESTLYTINLFEKKLIKIQIGLPAATPTLGDVVEFVLSTPNCNLGTSRPFAVTFYKGLVYIGMVCSAENGGTVNDMFAHIYTFDPSTSTFALLPGFPVPLNYTKGASHYNNNTMVAYGTAWNPWSDIATEHHDFSTGIVIRHPTPVLSDIDFSAGGDFMVLGFMDRASHQWGYGNRRPDGESGLYLYFSGGDILMAHNNTGTWQLESNGAVGSLTGCGSNNNQGPGGGEFLCNDRWEGDHLEIAVGGNIVNVARNSVKAALYDPITYDTGGTSDWSLNNGAETYDYQLFSSSMPATFGKSAGLGEPEILEESPSIEIGNRVWVDSDVDGIQDPDENPISGVIIQLLKGTTVIATDTTDANGNYYFSNAAGINTASKKYNISTLVPDMQYTIRIPNVTGTMKQSALSTYNLTLVNADATANGDLRDSDGNLIGDNADVIVMPTDVPIAGANNHTFDFGFILLPTCTLTANCNTVTQSNCSPANGSASVTTSGAQGNLAYLWSSGETTASISGKTGGTYTVTVTDDLLPGCTASCTVVVNSTVILPSVGCVKSDVTNCASPNGSATATATGVTYLWSNNATSSIINNLSAGTYTVTVTSTTTGCTNTCQAIVTNATVNPTCNIAVNSQPSCANLTGGSVTVTPSPAGTYSYVWSNGATTGTINNLTGGSYTVTVTNMSTNCTGMCQVTLDTPTNCCNITCRSRYL